MRYLVSLDLSLPKALETATRFTLKLRLRPTLDHERPPLRELRSYLDQAQKVGLEFKDQAIDYQWRQCLERQADRLTTAPDDLQTLETLSYIAELIREMASMSICGAPRTDTTNCCKIRADT